ncbi:hypothetical protein XBJ1_0825 [Xenorhabdus bovienii SS-2004]|uniref:Uncharacterized protein n=1 Tax=Xenorhabdus bovienii (strain SS-2004) TaxID=406818 RepID=D3UWY1_XENBS|nr:hypothetical protein XBJ1_0825 [Xenorhabdus bovienii SS-2004]
MHLPTNAWEQELRWFCRINKESLNEGSSVYYLCNQTVKHLCRR